MGDRAFETEVHKLLASKPLYVHAAPEGYLMAVEVVFLSPGSIPNKAAITVSLKRTKDATPKPIAWLNHFNPRVQVVSGLP